MVRVYRPSGQEPLVDAGRVHDAVGDLKKWISHAHGFPVFLQELMSENVVLSDDVLLDDLIARNSRNIGHLTLLVTRLDQCDSASDDIVRDDFAEAVSLGRINTVHCVLDADVDVNETVPNRPGMCVLNWLVCVAKQKLRCCYLLNLMPILFH